MKAPLAILSLIAALGACQDITGPGPQTPHQVAAVTAASVGGGNGIQSIAVFGLQTPNPVSAGTSATYGTVATNSLRVVFSGSLVGSCTVSLSAAGLPAGATASFSPAELTGAAGQSGWTLMTVYTTAATPGGPTLIFSAQATGTGGAGNACGSSDTGTAQASLTVVASPATTLTLAVPDPASIVYGSVGPIELRAALTRGSSGPVVAGATVAFLVDGVTAGSAITDASGVAGLPTYNPAPLSTGTHAVQASFAGGSVGGVALAASTSASEALTVTPNALPVVGPVSAPLTPVAVGTPVTVSAPFTDADVPESAPYTAVIDWGDGSATTLAYAAPGTISSQHAYGTVGLYSVTVTVGQDNMPANHAAETFQPVVVVDRSAGSVTGGGWIDLTPGAVTPSHSSSERATFGFVVRYDKNKAAPQGNLDFHLHGDGETLNATSFDWLVIDGTEARFMGSGTVNGRGDYTFVVSATDSHAPAGFSAPQAPASMLRITIWEKRSGAVVYDTQAGDVTTVSPTTHVSGGSIQIHRP
jgi:hypothetical protein